MAIERLGSMVQRLGGSATETLGSTATDTCQMSMQNVHASWVVISIPIDCRKYV